MLYPSSNMGASLPIASDIQAMARIYRQGQQKECVIYRLFTSGTVEEGKHQTCSIKLEMFERSVLFSSDQRTGTKSVIFQRQIQKGNLAILTVDGSIAKSESRTTTGFTKEELEECFTLKEECPCDTKRKIGDAWPSYGK